MKIAIIGYSGAGKSTLAKALGAHYGIPVLHLDSIHFASGWVEREDDAMRADLITFMQNKSWVIDGNYTRIYSEERFRQADYIVMMDFARIFCFFSALKRYFTYKGRSRDSVAAGCSEKMDKAFIKWLLWEGRTKERGKKFKAIGQQYPDKVVWLRNRRQTDRWLETMKRMISVHQN